ncbi:protein nessun dorma isoform X1 [Zerene cesonia]|uniref:protein nessun dorma isoform X1 n=2 Tax=Zerene cesonia TaxID=33412 RepID=UPI0018E55D79|nr:protein nessun dorma isoform X1 [Zerene cesonia]
MMPAVFTFVRSDNEILQELLRVFSSGRGNTREQWSIHAEALVEPVGWDALWKLSKEFCKKFEVRFPCVAYISVTSVNFEELSANIEVLSVQHEGVSLPETVMDVPLIELRPTIKQREECVNAASTAEFIDLLRFYYDNIWMPWDDQDSKILLPKNIEDRMVLWSDLHNGKIPGCVARSITLLRNSAINAHEKLKDFELSMCDEDLVDEDDSMLPANDILAYAEINTRLDGIMSKWNLYEDPLIRERYIAKAKNLWLKNKSKKNVVALWQGGPISDFAELSKFLQTHLTNEHTLTITASVEDGFALEPDEVVICSNAYEIPEIPLSCVSICSLKGAVLKAPDMRSCLLMMSEECRMQDLTLHCEQVNTIVVMKAGTLHMRKCELLDDTMSSQSDCAQGIVAHSGAKILLEHCLFENFYSGIVVHKGAQVELRNCVIKKCGVGIQMFLGSEVRLIDTVVQECTEQSIRCEMDDLMYHENTEGLHIEDNCKIGSGDLRKEVLIVNQNVNIG